MFHPITLLGDARRAKSKSEKIAATTAVRTMGMTSASTPPKRTCTSVSTEFPPYVGDRRKSHPDIFSPEFHQAAAKQTRREFALRKQAKEDLGLTLLKVRNNIFISDVKKFSRGWHLGLSVGDRIEQVDEMSMADATAFSAKEVYDMIKKAEKLEFAVRDQVVSKELIKQELLLAKNRARSREWSDVFRMIPRS